MSKDIIANMRMLCYRSEFGPTLFDMLTPLDLRSFQYAFGITLTERQMDMYMPLWRQFFVSRDFISYMRGRGYKSLIAGRHIGELVDMIMHPYKRMGTLDRMDLYLFFCGSLDMPGVVNFSTVMRTHLDMTCHEVASRMYHMSMIKDSVRYGNLFMFDYGRKDGDVFTYSRQGSYPTRINIAVVARSGPVDMSMLDATYMGGTVRMVTSQRMVMDRDMVVASKLCEGVCDNDYALTCMDMDRCTDLEVYRIMRTRVGAPAIALINRDWVSRLDVFEYTSKIPTPK
jgi:hypothetical protein